MPETNTSCSPIMSGIGFPSASAGFADVHVSLVAEETVSPTLQTLLRMTYGLPSILIVTGARRSFEATNRTWSSVGTGESFPPQEATEATSRTITAADVRLG